MDPLVDQLSIVNLHRFNLLDEAYYQGLNWLEIGKEKTEKKKQKKSGKHKKYKNIPNSIQFLQWCPRLLSKYMYLH